MNTRWAPSGCKYQSLQVEIDGRWATTLYEVRRMDGGDVYVGRPMGGWERCRGTLAEAKRAMEAEAEEAMAR